jgi:hypothetical protein
MTARLRRMAPVLLAALLAIGAALLGRAFGEIPLGG